MSAPGAFDTALCAALAREWRETVCGTRLERVLMPEPHRVDLVMGARDRSARLTFVLRPGAARCHPAADAPHGPASPPAFCMYLRRHVAGKRLDDVAAQRLERRLTLSFSGTDPMGDLRRFALHFEGFGPRPNLVVVGEDGLVMEAFRHVSPDGRDGRAVLPGLPYAAPRPSDKFGPDLPGPALRELLAGRVAPADAAERALVRQVAGLSPALARELWVRAGGEPAASWHGGPPDAAGFDAAWAEIAPALLGDAPEPTLVRRADGTPVAVLPIRPRAYGAGGGAVVLERMPSVGEALSRFDLARAEAERSDALRARLRRVVRARRESLANRLSRQEEELAGAEDDFALRHKGELILAYQASIPEGAASVELPDWEDGGRPLRIALDPQADPVREANRLFARYRKAHRRREALAPRIAEGREALSYLVGLEDTLEQAADRDTLELAAAEMARSRILGRRRPPSPPAKKGGRRPQRQAKAGPGLAFRPLRYVTRGGVAVWVGRTGWENDRLSLREAAPSDLWFHVAQGPGAHAVLRPDAGREVSDADRADAAALAAYHSPQRHGSHVEVDFSPAARLRKPPGAPPGLLLYDRAGSLSVTPEESAIRAMRVVAPSA